MLFRSHSNYVANINILLNLPTLIENKEEHKNIKFNSVLANDMEKNSKKIYNLNFPNSNFLLKDLNIVNLNDIPPHDIICLGISCQPFSIAGKQKGFDDKRFNVFWKVIEIIKHRSPEIVIIENVKNLKTHNKGKTYDTITNSITKLGYHIKSAILDTHKITNIPQHRERIYIVCFKDKNKFNNFNFDFKIVKNEKKIGRASCRERV